MGKVAGYQWLLPVILATQEAEIRRIMVWSQPQGNSSLDPISKKNPSQKKSVGVVQAVRAPA
jgi:hypothetical protein